MDRFKGSLSVCPKRSFLCVLIACLCMALPAAGACARAGEPGIAILVYHRFSDTGSGAMTVQVATFEQQLRFLNEHGYHVIPLRQAVDGLRDPSIVLPAKPVAITVDDGHRSVFEKLLPIVLRERIPVTLFIYPSAISNASYALTWDQVRTLRQSGWFDIQSHTYWHPNFNVERQHRTPDDYVHFVQWQLTASRQRIEAQTGAHVDMLAWPFGIHDDQLAALAAQAGYVAAFTLEAHKAGRNAQLLALPRFLMVDGYGPRAFARLLGEPDARAGAATQGTP